MNPHREDLESIGRLVKELPEDTPSMVWRSQLSQRLAAEQKPKRPFAAWLPGVLAAASAALVIVSALPAMMRSTAPGPVVAESWLMADHTMLSSAADLETGSMNPYEASDFVSAASWTEDGGFEGF